MIGVFDSGIGGLSVLRSLISAYPHQSFLYLGDTARLPYGNKSPSTIRKYSEQIMNFFADQKVEAIVIACNSASSCVDEKEWKSIPVFNVIDPGVRLALKQTQNGRVGILGTRATISSGVYQKRLQIAAEIEQKNLQAYGAECPLFVPLVEEGWLDDPLTNLIVFRYVQELKKQDCDTVVLGCTHYPFLRSAIQKAFGLSTYLVDSGVAVAEDLGPIIKKGPVDTEPTIRLLMTDTSKHYQRLVRSLLPDLKLADIEGVDL